MSDENDALRQLADDITRRCDPTVDVAVPAETEALYRSLPDGVLVLVREAFLRDRDHPDQPAEPRRSFGQGRIALIDQILADRRRERP